MNKIRYVEDIDLRKEKAVVWDMLDLLYNIGAIDIKTKVKTSVNWSYRFRMFR